MYYIELLKYFNYDSKKVVLVCVVELVICIILFLIDKKITDKE